MSVAAVARLATPAPQLTPPAQIRSEQRLLGLITEAEQVNKDFLGALSLRLQTNRDEVQRLTQESMKKVQETAQRAKESTYWSYLKDVATSVLAAVSVFFGLSLFAVGGMPILGGVLIASGILSVSNLIMTKSGAWDAVAEKIGHDNEELKKKLRLILPTSVAVASMLLGLGGGIASAATGALSVTGQAGALAQGVMTVIEAVISGGKEIAGGRVTLARADLDHDKTRLEMEQKTLERLTSSLNHWIKELGAAKRAAARAIQLSIQANSQIFQG